MRNWLFIALVIGLVGWAVYDFIDSRQTKEQAIQDVFEDQMTNYHEESGEQSGGKKQSNIQAGDRAENFQLKTVDGETIELAELEGKKILLNFWATWCPPCRDEMPDMQKYHEENDDIVILAVNL